jgi:hypothetical protein
MPEISLSSSAATQTLASTQTSFTPQQYTTTTLSASGGEEREKEEYKKYKEDEDEEDDEDKQQEGEEADDNIYSVVLISYELFTSVKYIAHCRKYVCWLLRQGSMNEKLIHEVAQDLNCPQIRDILTHVQPRWKAHCPLSAYVFSSVICDQLEFPMGHGMETRLMAQLETTRAHSRIAWCSNHANRMWPTHMSSLLRFCYLPLQSTTQLTSAPMLCPSHKDPILRQLLKNSCMGIYAHSSSLVPLHVDKITAHANVLQEACLQRLNAPLLRQDMFWLSVSMIPEFKPSTIMESGNKSRVKTLIHCENATEKHKYETKLATNWSTLLEKLRHVRALNYVCYNIYVSRCGTAEENQGWNTTTTIADKQMTLEFPTSFNALCKIGKTLLHLSDIPSVLLDQKPSARVAHEEDRGILASYSDLLQMPESHARQLVEIAVLQTFELNLHVIPGEIQAFVDEATAYESVLARHSYSVYSVDHFPTTHRHPKRQRISSGHKCDSVPEVLDTCTVCMCEIVKCLFVCGHVFCHTCTLQLLKNDTLCPICKHDIRHKDTEKPCCYVVHEQEEEEKGRRGKKGKGIFYNARPMSMCANDLYERLLKTQTPFMDRLEFMVNNSDGQVAIICRNIRVAVFMSQAIQGLRLWSAGSNPNDYIIITVDELLEYDIDLTMFGKIIIAQHQEKNDQVLKKIMRCVEKPPRLQLKTLSSRTPKIIILNQKGIYS